MTDVLKVEDLTQCPGANVRLAVGQDMIDYTGVRGCGKEIRRDKEKVAMDESHRKVEKKKSFRASPADPFWREGSTRWGASPRGTNAVTGPATAARDTIS